jgi:hypothetical protein
MECDDEEGSNDDYDSCSDCSVDAIKEENKDCQKIKDSKMNNSDNVGNISSNEIEELVDGGSNRKSR